MNTTHTCIALVGLALCSGAALSQGQPPGEGSVSRAEHEALRSDFEKLWAEIVALRQERDLRFEWVFSDVDDVAFAVQEEGHAEEGGHAEEEEEGNEAFITFNNERSGGYLQLAFRPTKSDMEFLRNLEFVGRYGWLDLPSGAPDAFDQERWTLGVNYWLNPSTVFKIAYEHTEVDGGDDFDAIKAMFAIGF